MNDLVKRLRASVNLGAVRGNSFERGVCESQMSEAASVITAMQEEIAALRHDIERHVAIAAEQATHIAALEKVVEAAALLFDNYELNDPWDALEEALREAKYLKG